VGHKPAMEKRLVVVEGYARGESDAIRRAVAVQEWVVEVAQAELAWMIVGVVSVPPRNGYRICLEQDFDDRIYYRKSHLHSSHYLREHLFELPFDLS
jgi:hypothetical protein